MAKARSDDFKSPECRLSYAGGLFKARAAAGSAREKYGCTLIFPKSARAELEKIVAKVIVDEWGEKGIAKAKAGLIKSPFLAGDGKEAHNKTTGEIHPGLGPDVFFIRPTANADRPAPFVRWRDPNTQETEMTVYSGCYGKAVLTCFAWNNPQNGDGVSFGIVASRNSARANRLAARAVRPILRSGWRPSLTMARFPRARRTARELAACLGEV